MPITRRDTELLSQGADRLGADIAESMRAAENRKLQKLLKGEELAAKKAQAESDLAQFNLIKGQNPKATVKVGDYSISPQDNSVRAAMIQDRADDQTRLETKALQDEYNRIQGKSRSQMASLKDIVQMLSSDNAITAGALRPLLARASGEVGALAEAEQKRALPGSLKEDVIKLKNYLTGGTDQPLTEDQRRAVLEYVKQKSEALKGALGAGQQELTKRAGSLAPTLARQKVLPNVISSLGSGAEDLVIPDNLQPLLQPKQKSKLESWLAGEKSAVKREYSPSRNQTRITYSDGTTEIVDGKK